jgi:hypothetical protein
MDFQKIASPMRIKLGERTMKRLLTLAAMFGCLVVTALFVPALASCDQGWTSLFDGKTLDGWERHGGFATYKIEDGTIVGTTAEGSPNTFLCKGSSRISCWNWRSSATPS